MGLREMTLLCVILILGLAISMQKPVFMSPDPRLDWRNRPTDCDASTLNICRGSNVLVDSCSVPRNMSARPRKGSSDHAEYVYVGPRIYVLVLFA